MVVDLVEVVWSLSAEESDEQVSCCIIWKIWQLLYATSFSCMDSVHSHRAVSTSSVSRFNQ